MSHTITLPIACRYDAAGSEHEETTVTFRGNAEVYATVSTALHGAGQYGAHRSYRSAVKAASRKRHSDCVCGCVVIVDSRGDVAIDPTI